MRLKIFLRIIYLSEWAYEIHHPAVIPRPPLIYMNIKCGSCKKTRYSLI